MGISDKIKKMLRVVCLSAVVAFATARRGSSEDKAWSDEAWKFDGSKITVKLTQVAEDKKPTTAPAAQWHQTTNSKVRGAKSYAMLSAGDKKSTFLVFTEKEMKGNEMPTAQDKVAVFGYTQEDKKASLEREGDKAVEAQKDFTFTLSNVQSLDADKNAAKSLEREEMLGMLPLSLPFIAASTFLGPAAFSFGMFPWGYSSSSLSASLEKLGSDLEVMDVPTHGLEREKFLPFAPFFMGPAFAAFGAGAAMAAPFMWGTPFGFM